MHNNKEWTTTEKTEVMTSVSSVGLFGYFINGFFVLFRLIFKFDNL